MSMETHSGSLYAVSYDVGDGKYITAYWDTISKAVTQVLNGNVGLKLSFEHMYGIIYKCVCNGYGEKLHGDLIEHCVNYVQQINEMFNIYERGCNFKDDKKKVEYIEVLNSTIEMYMCAIQQIAAMFAYLDKFYVEMSLHTSVHAELLAIFRQNALDNRIDAVIGIVAELLLTPFALNPAVVSSLIKNLHVMSKSEYSIKYPAIFSRYVPGVLPQMKEDELETYIQQTKQMQYQSRLVPEDEAARRGCKRHGDDENSGPALCVPTQQNT